MSGARLTGPLASVVVVELAGRLEVVVVARVVVVAPVVVEWDVAAGVEAEHAGSSAHPAPRRSQSLRRPWTPPVPAGDRGTPAAPGGGSRAGHGHHRVTDRPADPAAPVASPSAQSAGQRVSAVVSQAACAGVVSSWADGARAASARSRSPCPPSTRGRLEVSCPVVHSMKEPCSLRLCNEPASRASTARSPSALRLSGSGGAC